MNSDVLLTGAKVLVGLGALVYGIIATYTDLHETDGQHKRLTPAGRWGIGLAVVCFGVGAGVDIGKDWKDRHERALADSVAKARTDEINRMQREAQRNLEQILVLSAVIQGQNAELGEQQAQAVDRIQDVATAAERVTVQQTALERGLNASLNTTRRIGADLRQIGAETERSARDMLASLERARSPLTSVAVTLEVQLPPDTALTAYTERMRRTRTKEFLAFLQTFAQPTPSALRAMPPPDSQIPTLVHRGRTIPMRMPLMYAYVWNDGTGCTKAPPDGASFVNLTGTLLPEAARPVYDSRSRSVRLRWQSQAMQLRTNRNVSVDELRGACIGIRFMHPATDVGASFFSPDPSSRIWTKVEVTQLHLEFPQGRREMLLALTHPEGSRFWVDRLGTSF